MVPRSFVPSSFSLPFDCSFVRSCVRPPSFIRSFVLSFPRSFLRSFLPSSPHAPVRLRSGGLCSRQAPFPVPQCGYALVGPVIGVSAYVLPFLLSTSSPFFFLQIQTSFLLTPISFLLWSFLPKPLPFFFHFLHWLSCSLFAHRFFLASFHRHRRISPLLMYFTKPPSYFRSSFVSFLPCFQFHFISGVVPFPVLPSRADRPYPYSLTLTPFRGSVDFVSFHFISLHPTSLRPSLPSFLVSNFISFKGWPPSLTSFSGRP
jgi:hypothetical protein